MAGFDAAGPEMFARYAYPPNALGYCGPPDASALFEANAARDTAVVRHLAGAFTGAWPYLQLLAASNHIEDPLDRRVVEAYWVGNELCGSVSPRLLAASLDDRFARRAGRSLPAIIEPATALGGLAHHSFHVFAVYPWLGLLRAGVDGPPLQVLDRCRIRSGTVLEVHGEQATVAFRPIEFARGRLRLGAQRSEVVRHAAGSDALVRSLAPGDVVALHWDWVCDRLDAKQRRALDRITDTNLDAVNRSSRPGPAVVLDRFG